MLMLSLHCVLSPFMFALFLLKTRTPSPALVFSPFSFCSLPLQNLHYLKHNSNRTWSRPKVKFYRNLSIHNIYFGVVVMVGRQKRGHANYIRDKRGFSDFFYPIQIRNCLAQMELKQNINCQNWYRSQFETGKIYILIGWSI
jgi:hypothetical protein